MRIERIERRGKPIPDDMIPPAILPGYEGWYDAFYELGTDRHIGNAIGPIPAGSIARHTEGWPPCEAGLFRRVIRSMDRVYLGHLSSGGAPDAPESDNPARDAFRAAMKKGPAK